MYATVIRAIRRVKKASASNTTRLSPVSPLNICLAFSRILAMKKFALLSTVALIIASGLLACKSQNRAATSVDKAKDAAQASVQGQAAAAAAPSATNVEVILGSYVG